MVLLPQNKKTWTARDHILAKVADITLSRWRDTQLDDFLQLQQRREELSVEGGCVLFGSIVVIPRAGRQMLLEELHAGHPGVTRMKRLARTVLWWLGLDSNIENKV